MKKVLAALLLLALAFGAYRARIHLIRAFLRPGPLRATVQVLQPRRAGPLAPVRVLLVDGLSARVAEELPAHRRLCGEGLRLAVDAGFPTVSLPVQHVLWTGAWQAESGVTFAVERLPRRLLASLPELTAARSGNAVAVAESHREIVASFPFTRIVAPPERGAPLTPLALQQAALDAAQSSAALVFVHTLAVDEAGHLHGSLSPAYRAAARRSDELLAALLAVRRPDWTLLVMADHGHLARGGHGDVEDEVRFTRACLAGRGIPTGRELAVGLPDLTLLLAERLGIDPPPAAAANGHRLAALLEGAPPARPPAPALAPRRLLLALAALALLVATFLWRRGQLAGRRSLLLLLPWGPLAALLLLLCLGPPSLSCAFVYPAVSPLLLWVGLVAGLLLSLQLVTARSLGAPAGLALTLLVVGLLAPTLAALLLGGWPLLQPPLVPFWSGWASSMLGVTSAALPVLAVALVLHRRP